MFQFQTPIHLARNKSKVSEIVISTRERFTVEKKRQGDAFHLLFGDEGCVFLSLFHDLAKVCALRQSLQFLADHWFILRTLEQGTALKMSPFKENVTQYKTGKIISFISLHLNCRGTPIKHLSFLTRLCNKISTKFR